MRVLLSCQQGAQHHRIPAYQFWRSYFVNSIREAGHECIEIAGVDWAEGLACNDSEALSSWRDRSWERVVNFARAEQRRKGIDLFLAYLYPRQIDQNALGAIQRLGIPCVNFFCDNVRELRTVPAEFQSFDLNWVPEYEALHMYRKAGIPFVHAPMPCWVPPEFRHLPTCETEPATFIGSIDILRQDILGRAIQLGSDVIVRGRGWAERSEPPKHILFRSKLKTVANQWVLIRSHGLGALLRKIGSRVRPLQPPPLPERNVCEAPVAEHEYFRITREAKVTIGINRVITHKTWDWDPLVYSRLRDIEAPMLGACYLTEWTEGLSTLYEIGVDIETYRTAEELVSKLDELGNDPGRRMKMRKNAQQRAVRDHTVGRSLHRVMEHLGLPVAP